MRWLVAGTLFIVALVLISLAETAQDVSDTSDEQRVSIVGCVRREENGRGVAGREFMLTNAAMTASGSEVAGTVGNDAAAASNAAVYRLTGANEAQMNQYVGARVEIVGVVTDGPARREVFRDLEVTSVRPTVGTCTEA